MARVQDVAKITAAALGTRDQETVDSRAYLVWEFARKSGNVTPAPGGGLHYRGNLTEVILKLWPSLAPKDRHHDLEDFRREVYAYLRATGNAHCRHRSSIASKVVWWLAGEWQKPGGSVVIRVPASVKPTSTERKLTKEEAGEDRAPAPVKTRKINNDEKDVSMTTAAAVAPSAPAKRPQPAGFAERIQRRKDEHTALLDLITEMFEKLTEPVSANEITAASGFNVSTVRNALTELCEAGRLFWRDESYDEKRIRFGGPVTGTPGRLYAASAEVAERPRTQREVIPGVKLTHTMPRSGDRKSRTGGVGKKLLAVLTRTYAPITEIATAAGVSPTAASSALRLLYTQGRIDRKVDQETHRLVYRKKRSDIASSRSAVVPKNGTAAPVGTSVPSFESAPASGTPREMAISVVEGLINQLAQSATESDEIIELRAENARLQARVDEVESALAGVQKLFGKS